MSASFAETDGSETCDIVIVGAGIAGINAAYRIQTELPRAKLIILDARETVGGTWDLFRYPGVRSDSDVHTLGFEWHPYPSKRPIVEGGEFQDYVQNAVDRYNINVQFQRRVLSADWSSKTQRWNLEVEHQGRTRTYTPRWTLLATVQGYFDHETPLEAKIPGIEHFKGIVIHPQFWPADYNDYSKQKIALIGSGATAISIFPVLAETAAQVTMVQRSPSYVMTFPNTLWTPTFLPAYFLHLCKRWYFIIISFLVVWSCRLFPRRARQVIREGALVALPKRISHDPHFDPTYEPWTQRMNVDPDSNFFKSLHRSNTQIVTGEILTVTDKGITMQGGEEVEADVIITATGIKVTFGGGIKLRVDGRPVELRKRFVWKGTLLDGIPNLAWMFGYVDASWTLGTDNNAIVFTRIFKDMECRGHRTVVARAPPAMESRGFWRLTSTYSLRAKGEMPQFGSLGNWKPRTKAPVDFFYARWGDVRSGLEIGR